MKGYIVCVYKSIKDQNALKNTQQKLEQQLRSIKVNFWSEGVQNYN